MTRIRSKKKLIWTMHRRMFLYTWTSEKLDIAEKRYFSFRLVTESWRTRCIRIEGDSCGLECALEGDWKEEGVATELRSSITREACYTTRVVKSWLRFHIYTLHFSWLIYTPALHMYLYILDSMQQPESPILYYPFCIFHLLWFTFFFFL